MDPDINHKGPGIIPETSLTHQWADTSPKTTTYPQHTVAGLNPTTSSLALALDNLGNGCAAHQQANTSSETPWAPKSDSLASDHTH